MLNEIENEHNFSIQFEKYKKKKNNYLHNFTFPVVFPSFFVFVVIVRKRN